VWLSSSGGSGETYSRCRAISGKALLAERQSRCPLEPVLGRLFEENIYNHFRLYQYKAIIPIGTTVKTITKITNG
jgi:hypothetical protein